MDPISVLKTLWRHKWAALPMALLTIVACVYVMFFAQRTYEATMTYALLSPKTPTEAELRASRSWPRSTATILTCAAATAPCWRRF